MTVKSGSGMRRSPATPRSGRASHAGGSASLRRTPGLLCELCGREVSASFGLRAHQAGAWCRAYQTANRMHTEGYEVLDSKWGAACSVAGLPVRLMATGVDVNKGRPAAQHWAPEWLCAAIRALSPTEVAVFMVDTEVAVMTGTGVPMFTPTARRVLTALNDAEPMERDILVGALRLHGVQGVLDMIGDEL